jgi:hypothetical protein
MNDDRVNSLGPDQPVFCHKHVDDVHSRAYDGKRCDSYELLMGRDNFEDLRIDGRKVVATV